MVHFSVILLLVSLVKISSCVPLADDKCMKGVEYWCQNEHTAKQCSVSAFCRLNGLFKDGDQVNVKPVQIDLYYEALCPGCRRFILEQLYPAYQSLYHTGIFEIGLFPYGNAHEKQVGDKWEFECQHGVVECQMNLVETCALHLLSHPDQFMTYIHCVENEATLTNAKKCADDLHIEWDPIAACYNGSEGNYLEHVMAQKTDALVPKHKYVPWIVVDGKHTEGMQLDAQYNLITFLCDTYKGEKPEECKDTERVFYKENF